MPFLANIARRHGRAEVRQDIIDRPVFIVFARRRHQVVNDLVILAVLLGELLFEP